MPVFSYTVKSADGKNIKGSIEANTKEMAIASLKNNGYYPLQIVEKHLLDQDISFGMGNSIKTKDLAIFCRQFSVAIDAGVSILGCLTILKEQTENKKLKSVLEKVFELVQKGVNLSEAMRKHEIFLNSSFSLLNNLGADYSANTDR